MDRPLVWYGTHSNAQLPTRAPVSLGPVTDGVTGSAVAGQDHHASAAADALVQVPAPRRRRSQNRAPLLRRDYRGHAINAHVAGHRAPVPGVEPPGEPQSVSSAGETAGHA